MGDGNHSMWEHLPLLVRANSKDSVEYILQALWRTRRTGLDAADRQIFRDILQLSEYSDLDPLLVCLRVLIRNFVYENVNKDDIQKLFPAEVLPELQRLLTILLQKFQKEWREDISKDPETVPRLKAMTWNMANQNVQHSEPVAVINLRLQIDAQPNMGDKNVKFQLAKDSMEMMLKSMYCIKDQLSDPGETLERRIVHQSNVASSSLGLVAHNAYATLLEITSPQKWKFLVMSADRYIFTVEGMSGYRASGLRFRSSS